MVWTLASVLASFLREQEELGNSLVGKQGHRKEHKMHHRPLALVGASVEASASVGVEVQVESLPLASTTRELEVMVEGKHSIEGCIEVRTVEHKMQGMDWA